MSGLVLAIGFASAELRASVSCTGEGEDSWSSGQHVDCCDGLSEVLNNWDGGTRYYYKCYGSPTPSPPPSPSPPSPSPGGGSWYKTITPSDNTGLCIDLPGEDIENGTPLWLWECNGLESQKWVFDSWQIRLGADEGFCIDAGDMSPGGQLYLWGCNGYPQQTWGYDGSVQRVYLADTSVCLDFYEDWQSSSQPLHTWDCNGYSNQYWSLWDAPSPAPTPSPAPSPTPTGDCDGSCGTGYEYCNPLGIDPDPYRSNNYFLAIGDWGAPLGDHMVSCQRTIAAKMKDYINARSAEGKRLLFIAAVGDNFYWSGQKGDTWDSQWADVYGVNDPSSPFYQVPWLVVQGNHDLGTSDPGCACGANRCHQFTENSPYPNLWWMPDYNWHYEIPQIGLEIIGVDMNGYNVDELNGHGHSADVHNYCGGRSNVADFLGGVVGAAEDLLQCRAASGTASTVFIMQHYPAQASDVISKFADSNARGANYLHATGHTHAQSCRASYGTCYDLLTGGGGGCGWDAGAGSEGGFSAVHLDDDGGYSTVIDSDEVNINGNCWADVQHALSNGVQLDDPIVQDAWTAFGNSSWLLSIGSSLI